MDMGTALMTGGSLLRANNTYNNAQAEASASQYNAQVADINANLALQQAEWAGQQGTQEAATSQLKTRAQLGGIEASQGASGIDVGSESFTRVRDSARTLGMLDTLTIRSNAARKAYGYKVEAASERAAAGLEQTEAKNRKKQGYIETATTVLGDMYQSSAYNKYLSNKSILPDFWGGE